MKTLQTIAQERQEKLRRSLSEIHGVYEECIKVYESTFISPLKEHFAYGVDIKHATIGFSCKFDLCDEVSDIKRNTVWDKEV